MKWTKNQIEEMRRNGFECVDGFYGDVPVYSKENVDLINDLDEIDDVLNAYDNGMRVCIMRMPKGKAKYMVYECESDGYWLFGTFKSMMTFVNSMN